MEIKDILVQKIIHMCNVVMYQTKKKHKQVKTNHCI